MHCSSARSPAGVTAAQNNGRPANTAMLQGTRPAHLASVREPRAEGHILRQAVRVPHLRARPPREPGPGPPLLHTLHAAVVTVEHCALEAATSAATVGDKRKVPRPRAGESAGRRECGAARPARLVGRGADEEGAAAGDRHARHRAAVLRQVRDHHAARLPGRRRGRACRAPARRGVYGLRARPCPSQGRGAAVRRARPETEVAGSDDVGSM